MQRDRYSPLRGGRPRANDGEIWFEEAVFRQPPSPSPGHYVERIGMLPRPMTDDYAEVIANRRATVAESYGIEAAVDGVGSIVHCAGSAKGDEDKTRNLLRAASTVGAQNLVYISVVGAERIPVASGVDRAMFGYFASKRAAERIVEDSGLPWTTLRATQFHDSMLRVARQMAKMPMIPVQAGLNTPIALTSIPNLATLDA